MHSRRPTSTSACATCCAPTSPATACSGPNIELYRHLCARFPRLAVQASGGVREAADLAAAREAGCAGIVLGKSLLEGRLKLPELMEGRATC